MKLTSKQIQDKRDTCVLSFEYTAVTHRITSPGKFEGEPIFAPYYWNMIMDGLCDFDDGNYCGFKFTKDCEDFQVWPELKQWLNRKRTLKLRVDDQGFVHCR